MLDKAKSLIPPGNDHLLDTLIIAERGLPPERLLGRPHRGPRQEPAQHRGSASSVAKLSGRPGRSGRRSDTDHGGPEGRHRVARAPRPPGESATVLMSATRRQGKRCPTTDWSLPPPLVPSRTASPSAMRGTSARAAGMPRNEQRTGTAGSSSRLRLRTSGGANFGGAELAGTGNRGVPRGAPGHRADSGIRAAGSTGGAWHAGVGSKW